MIDLSPLQHEIIMNILQKYVTDCDVWAFGSRVTWTAKDYSDLDLAVVGKEKLANKTLYALQEAFEESDLPFRVDILDWHAISPEFQKVIKSGYEVIKKKVDRGNKWTTDKVGNVTLVNTDTYSPKEKWTFVNYLDTGNITEGTILGIQFISDIESLPSRAKRKVQQGDIVYSTVRPNQKHYGIIATLMENMLVSTGFAVLRGIEGKCDTKFLYYFLTQEQIIGHLQTIAEHSTSAYPSIRPSDIELLEIKLPPLAEQRAIARILGTLDDKIELNRKMNETLEAMARAIFKSWFVDFDPVRAKSEGRPTGLPEEIEMLFPDTFEDSELGEIPKGWKVGKLGEILDAIESGSRPKGGVGILDDGIPSIGAENIIGLGLYDYSKEKFVSREFFKNMRRGIIQSSDVLIYKDGANLGRKSLFMDDFPHKECAVNEHVFILRANKTINQFFLYFWLDQDFMTENIRNLNTNSAQPGINQPGISSLPILIPDKILLLEFEEIIRPILSELFNNCKQSATLAAIRDALLPKLMSGEIKVLDVERFVEATL